MNKLFLPSIIAVTISLLCFTYSSLFAQNMQEVTPEIEKKINNEIEQAAKVKKMQYKKDKDLSEDWIEFSLDTFRISQYEEKYMSYNYSTVGMNTAMNLAADKYDQLLNKYYKKLLNVLDKNDKEALIEAQRAWIAFRDKEMQLESTLEQDRYSGGGTMQILRHASVYEELIRKRVIEIFEYYNSIGNP